MKSYYVVSKRLCGKPNCMGIYDVFMCVLIKGSFEIKDVDKSISDGKTITCKIRRIVDLERYLSSTSGEEGLAIKEETLILNDMEHPIHPVLMGMEEKQIWNSLNFL